MADIFDGQPFLNYADCAIIGSLMRPLCLDCKYFSFVALSITQMCDALAMLGVEAVAICQS